MTVITKADGNVLTGSNWNTINDQFIDVSFGGSFATTFGEKVVDYNVTSNYPASGAGYSLLDQNAQWIVATTGSEIGRASCRERV